MRERGKINLTQFTRARLLRIIKNSSSINIYTRTRETAAYTWHDVSGVTRACVYTRLIGIFVSFWREGEGVDDDDDGTSARTHMHSVK